MLDQKRCKLAPALDLTVETAAHLKALAVLLDVDPGADRIRRTVLEQHADALGPALLEALLEGTRHDDIACRIALVEQARIADEHARRIADRKRPHAPWRCGARSCHCDWSFCDFPLL